MPCKQKMHNKTSGEKRVETGVPVCDRTVRNKLNETEFTNKRKIKRK